MGSLTVTAFENAMKRWFIDRRVNKINYVDHPWLAMCPKDEQFDAFDAAYPLNIEDPTGVSNRFSIAQANRSPTEWARFIPTRSRVYGVVSIDNEAIRASESKRGAFVKGKVEEVQNVLSQCSRRLASQIARDGSGRIGSQTAAISANVITLSNPEEVVFFAKNMWLEASQNDGTDAAHTLLSGRAQVASVQRDAGTVTLASTPAAWTNATQHYFPEGDFRQAFQGKEAWVPATAPTSGDSFFSEDRSDDPVRLAGVRFDGNSTPAATGLSIANKLKKASARLKREGGGGPDYYVMNDDRYAELEIELESRKQIQHVESPHAGIGFDMMVVHTGGKKTMVMADHNFADNVAFGDRMDTWKLCSLGKLPGFLTDQKFIIEPTSDGFQVRIGGYGQLMNHAPGYNCRVDLDA